MAIVDTSELGAVNRILKAVGIADVTLVTDTRSSRLSLQMLNDILVEVLEQGWFFNVVGKY